MNEPSSPSLFPDDTPPRTAVPPPAGDADRVAKALALLWTYRPRTTTHTLLPLLGWRRGDGRAFTQDDVKGAIAELRRRGWIRDMPRRDGYFRLADEVRGSLYRAVLDETPLATLREALHRLDDRYGSQPGGYPWALYDPASAVALVRLELHSGASMREIERLRSLVGRTFDWDEVASAAVLPSFDPALFERIAPEWGWAFACAAVGEMCVGWRADTLPVCEWALGKLGGERARVPESMRLALAELLVHRGQQERAREAIDGLSGGAADGLRACMLVQSGRWADAQFAFEAAFKARQTETGARKRLFPASVAWLYPLALLAQRTPKHLELARRFCLGEAGKRNPPPHAGWGRWVHAIGVRLGDAKPEAAAHFLRAHPLADGGLDALWELLLAAWLGAEATGLTAAKRAGEAAIAQLAGALRDALLRCRLGWLAAQVDAAEAALGGRQPATPFFVSGPREQWRDTLAALQALGADPSEREPGADATRIVWAVRVGAGGAVESIEPFEQKRGPRGWSKAKALPLSRLAGSERLSPWDTKVARAIRQDRVYGRRWELDRAAAIMALVGHPAVVLADAPEQLVDVVEGAPEVEVAKEGERYLVRITPSVRPDDDRDEPWMRDAAHERESQALRSITVVQDTPQRLQVIRLTAAQRRAAQLVSDRLVVPAGGHEELQAALRALAGHFQVHADHAQAARDAEPESRLRAELAPIGDRLLLRLVAAPLGPAGPRVVPATGRARLMAAIGSETVGTRRDLAAERAHVEAVLSALPFLEEVREAGNAFEWLIDDPEEALEAVEALPKLAAIAAVDWPKGKPVRVATADVRHLAVVVKGERDWFRLRARAVVDETTVVDFEALLAAARAKSRFVPMGEGVYVALTRTLKRRLADLAAVAETGRDGARVPRFAAAWLEDVLEDAQVESDAAFRDAIERLHRAQDETPELPRSLQAQLRPYQEDGYRWALRLAAARLGGCLADDMGLGKTLQGLAVLLARGAGGAALVIAPTSVCGNWLAEARRFAPTLDVAIYGEGERDALIGKASCHDVIVVSYTLLQQARERFAARSWHTVIADEAQAIKNAAAKRSLAVYELDADFRLALSGTPVENRLAELWSIMNFANPGLLGTLARFTERFATPIERDRDRDAQYVLKRLIGPFVLRRTKAQVLPELPPRTELNVAVAPAPAEAAHYEALRREAAADVDRALATESAAQARFNILAQLMRLRRAACDPRLVSPELGIAGAKVQAFMELAAELAANGHKALVFSQFTDFLRLLREPLDAAGIAYQYLDGATPAGERTRRIDAFQAGQGELFLISLKAGGFGLNLTAADYVLITDPWWNPAAEDQAMGRAHRLGQTRPVTVYRLVTKGTVEERIVALHQDKRALAEGVLGEGDAALLPSADDLMALIRGDA